ncbi:hypothetical protein WG947_10010 [Pontibacter sp. H259]|uniref:hypothetical protein n=1 Tax=Pontibacter sp. H259 TaxID=3133421 RepID=UPI0030C5932B
MKKHNGELEIDEDLKLEHRTWTVQRVSWGVMLLLVLAALLGFTGRGGLPGISTIKETSASQTIELEYQRFLRSETVDELSVKLKDLKTTAPTLYFSKDFVERMQVEQIVPEPEKVETGPDGITYTFSTTQAESHIVFYTKPLEIGNLQVTMRGPDNSTINFSQFVYP